MNGKRILVSAEKDPPVLPWKEHKIDIVIECTGIFNTIEKASKHIEAGAKKVILSSPAKDGMPTFVMGVNHENYDLQTHHVMFQTLHVQQTV